MAERNGSGARGADARGPNDDRPLVTGPSLGPIPYHWVAAIVVCVGTFPRCHGQHDHQHRPAHPQGRVRPIAGRCHLGGALLHRGQHRSVADDGPPGRPLRSEAAVRVGVRRVHDCDVPLFDLGLTGRTRWHTGAAGDWRVDDDGERRGDHHSLVSAVETREQGWG